MNKQEKLQELYPEDLYGYSAILNEAEVDKLYELRQVLNTHLKPVIAKHWNDATFPHEEFQKVKDLHLMDDPSLFEGRDDKYSVSQAFFLFRSYELARTDASLATFFGVHAGLCYHTILVGGSEEQKEYYLPKLASHEFQGCFALTEPDHGSDISGGLATTARREGDKWIINGEKRWIGGGGIADVVPVFARDEADGQIKCFIMNQETPGFTSEFIENKMALRMVPNYHLYFNDAEVDDSARLENINSFKDVNKVLSATRADVSHEAAGMIAGILEAALEYTTEREQFGKPTSKFQLVQEKLAMIQANAVTTLGISARLAEMQEAGNTDGDNASLAKMQNSLLLRQSAAYGRELLGGNGIVVDYGVGRFFADAEAIYSYEGTHQMNALIIGRKVTGDSAFV